MGIRKVLFWVFSMGAGILLTAAVVVFAYINTINRMIDGRIAQLHSAQSSKFFALYPPLEPQQRLTRAELKAFLIDQGYAEKKTVEDLLPGEYAWENVGKPASLVLNRPAFQGPGHALDPLKVRLTFDDTANNLTLTEIKRLDSQSVIPAFERVPKQIGTFLAGRLRTQDSVTLSDMPVSIRLAVMAIEDAKFLEHYGVSIRGTLRALWTNIRSGRASQGGSTITQQLMKNLFFSNKKELSRKAKEAVFAFITEMRYSKEAILEAYLNEVYLGQWSTHEIHGVSEGARYYFNRPVSELTLAQSATLAAIIQAPNAHDPRRNPDRALKRRNLVLKKMLEAEFILPPEYELAIAEPLDVVPAERSLDDVDYYLDLVMDELPKDIRKRLDNNEVLTLYVTLNPQLQTLASKALSENIDRLQKTSPLIQKNAKRGIRLQGALVAVDPGTCSVLALQGGKNYRQTQFNRVLQGKRQPGSLFKPFVVLSAFSNPTSEGPVTPVTLFEDSLFEWKYENQLWKPKNYDSKFRGMVTVRQALENSINIPTARIAQRVGIPSIVDTLKKAGITSPLPVVPSLTLGSAEVTPFELAEAFTTVANIGKACQLRSLVEAYDENRNIIFENKVTSEARLKPTAVYQTIDLMKGVFANGTARSALSSGINLANFAGKTGTTNEAKDAWFIGFSPRLLVLVWVGFDEEEKVGYAGSTAALPIWVDFVKNAGLAVKPEDFAIPDGLVRCDFSPEGPANIEPPPGPFEYFQAGTEPNGAKCEKVKATEVPAPH